ncbi:MAG: hypothetical protein HUU20_11665 [Pirellulales bacterium]|nr:hypothetical protein [Pirellulales bacterium]
MLDQNDGTLRSVAWLELFPWLGIFRCFRLAIGFRMLLLGAAGMLLTVSGWALLGFLFSGSPEVAQQVEPYDGCPWLALTSLVPERPLGPSLPPHLPEAGESSELVAPSQSYLLREPGPVWWLAEPIYGTWEQLGRPARDLFDARVSWTRLVFLLLAVLWAIAVWAWFGGAITRVAAVRLAAEERVSWGDMVRYAGAKWPAYFVAPLFPLVGVLLLTVPMGIVAILLRVGIGVFLLGLVWWLFLIAGLVMALLLLALLAGWPLMWATISAEGTDSFDALSRTYAYVYQRPLHYLFYIGVAFLLGVLGWLLVANFAAGAVHLTYWAAHWGAGTERVFSAIAANQGDLGVVGEAGGVLIRFWVEGLKLLAAGFLASYFWIAFTAIYFLMRRQVDATEMDEVYLEEEQDDDAHGLPPLKTDEAGVPTVDDMEDREAHREDV